ncbi:M17 family metallopeptidase [Roseomonas sp. AR75]|uniref:leucyl aminopeptidase family protein n=1 Tax=Roseomonas sp. AR75 TaxID=2562311 RepID=UPI0010C07D84|nr:leucyl aminopeptidase family protein [Roseomonas sp. AR75]
MLKVSFRRASPDPALPLVRPIAAVPAGMEAVAAAQGFRAEAGQVLEAAAAPRRIWLGLGAGTRQEAEIAGAAAAARLHETPQLLLDATRLAVETTCALAAGAALRAWRFDAHRTRDVAPRLARLVVLTEDVATAKACWEATSAAVRGCLFARELVAEPANHLTTKSFVKRLEGLAEHGIHVDVLGRKRLTRAGFGGLLAVGAGGSTPPRLAVLRWRGSIAAPPVVFVGKGIVFDTGGISIKPAQGMETMRADMAGAAACAGAMLSLALRRSPAPAVAVLAIAENATDARSYRPSDVLRMLSGRTVEVVDTDAEGRLVLADALHYATSRFRPRAVVDLATLTGAIVSALGHHRAGLFGNDAALMSALAAAGEAVGEALWPMPIGEGHRADLASDIADLRQCMPSARGEGGWAARFIPDACHAAAFLREFVAEGVPWAHLDIAGVDTQDAPHPLGPAGPTGFGVRLLDALVAAQFEEEDHHAAP